MTSPGAAKIAGCLLGGALGDALGLPHEGAKPVDDVQFVSGAISDDTQLTLATCEGIVAGSGVVRPELIAERFAAWFREGRVTGVGATTLRSLRALSAGDHWAIAGRSGEFAAGAGAAMRVAPLAFALDPFDIKARVVIRDVVRITHNNDEAYAAALAVVLAVTLALRGERGHRALGEVADAMPDSLTRDALTEICARSLSTPDAVAKFGTSGHAAAVVPVALCAGFTGEDVLTALGEVVRFGGDADTIASIAGQVLGARVGLDLLPAVAKRVDVYDEVVRIAGALEETNAPAQQPTSWWRRLLRSSGV